MPGGGADVARPTSAGKAGLTPDPDAVHVAMGADETFAEDLFLSVPAVPEVRGMPQRAHRDTA